MAAEAARQGWAFPYLYDETQAVAKAYRAACTPDFFLFDGDRRLVYRGQLDASRPGNGLPVTGADLRAAVDAVLAGQPGRPRTSAPASAATSSGSPATSPTTPDHPSPGDRPTELAFIDRDVAEIERRNRGPGRRRSASGASESAHVQNRDA